MKAVSHILSAFAAAFLAAICAFSQTSSQEKDRFVRLMSAQSVRMTEVDGKTFRKAEGPARFLHNNTWLICDTALWDVERQIIYARGNVSIEQDQTELTSDHLTYYCESNLAEFRGTLVQLRDKEGSTLRTTNLDYNTKDSVAVFRDGGAMMDYTGQLIESIDGTYESKLKKFTFNRDVNMFSDSVFVKTSYLEYNSGTNVAIYPNYVEAWNGDNMLSSASGWYDRRNELFFFIRNVHLMNPTREAWSDSLRFERVFKNVDLLGNVQLVDTVRQTTTVAGSVCYVDSLSTTSLRRNPVVIIGIEEKVDSVLTSDSLYFRADEMDYWTVQRRYIPEEMARGAIDRRDLLKVDAVANIRAKAAEAAAKAAAEAAENDPNAPPSKKKDRHREVEQPPKLDSLALKAKQDSIAMVAVRDSIARADSIAAVLSDSSAIGFASARGKVKVFRKTMQVSCDSLLYSDLDSLARLFVNPVIWNEGRHQYNADSICAVIRNGKMSQADLMSNAFIHVDEDHVHFDQIRSAEMMAYFSDSTTLQRFDALGSATALFFLKEKDKIGTVNRKECSVLSAEMENGEISKVSYFENPKSDAFPVAQMKKEDMFLKGYSWNPDARPSLSKDFTNIVLRPSQRKYYESRPKASFIQTEKYFKGYISKLYRDIERSDSLKRVNEARRQREDSERENLRSKSFTAIASASTAATADSTALAGKVALADSLKTAQDSVSLSSVSDSLSSADSLSPKAAQRAIRKAQAQARREARIAAREAKWAEKDARDAAKAAAKTARKIARKKAHEEKILQKLMQKKALEDEFRKKYRDKLLFNFNFGKKVKDNASGKD